MMKRKILLGTLLSVLITTVGFAQSNLGEEYYYVKNYDFAKDFFEKQVSQSENVANAYYYLGQIALAQDDAASAKSNFEKGVAADPENVLNSIGLAQLKLSTDPKSAEDVFKDATKKNKKDAGPWIAIAYAYLHAENREKAQEAVKNARKADKNSSLAFVCEGDIISHFDKTQDGNNVAVGAYEQAKYFDPNSVVALVKLAEAYNKTGNGQESAIGYLNSAIEKRPDYIPAYRFLGKLYYVSGNYGKTIEVYQKFFTGSLKDVAEDYADYAGAYYFTMQFDNAKNILQEGIAKFPNDFYLNRLLMYVSVDTKDYAKGIEYGDKFFSIKRENAPYLIDDYMKYATALTYQNRGEEAVAQYKKAIEMDPDNLAVYKAVANAASSADRPGDAGDIFSEYIKKGGAEVVTGDYFTLGNYYYRAGSGVIYQAANDTTGLISPQQLAEAKEQLVKADSAFAKVVELEPDNYLGYLFRARVNASLDPSSEQGLAKPYYEGLAANILKSNGSKLPNDPEFANLTELREAYYYLSFYTYLRYEKDKSAATKNLLKEYSEKLLAISPEGSNEANIAQQLLDYSKQ